MYDKNHFGKGRKSRTGVIGTLGVIIGDTTYPTNNTTPESYDVQKYLNQMVEEGCQCAVMEASSLGLKWHRTDGLVFDYGVFHQFFLQTILEKTSTAA